MAVDDDCLIEGGSRAGRAPYVVDVEAIDGDG